MALQDLTPKSDALNLPAVSISIKNGGVSDDIYQNLLRILRYESKDTTYKFALLRSLIEISSESLHFIREDSALIRAPFGLLVEKWVQYYWPIVEQDIPQKHGGEKTKPLAFRSHFKVLTDVYCQKGGYAQFRHDYHNGRLNDPDESTYLKLLQKIRQTIATMPMKHLGQSVSKTLYAIVYRPTLSKIPQPQPGELSPRWVVQNLGYYQLRRDYHDAFQKIGGLLIGTDAILYHWAEFTARIQKDPFTPEDFQKIFQTLNKTYEEDRQVRAAKKCYLEAMQTGPIYCVWCETPLSIQNLAIDHVLPFSQTQNNNLWNLLPSCKKCNSAKSNSIPTPEAIKCRKDRILASWRLQSAGYPEAFEQELRYDLVGFDKPAFVSESSLEYLSARCDFLIRERGYNTWDKN